MIKLLRYILHHIEMLDVEEYRDLDIQSPYEFTHDLYIAET